MNPNTMPLEAETRVLIDRSLENLGWKLSGKDQNVYYEQHALKQRKRSCAESVRTMFCTRRIAISP